MQRFKGVEKFFLHPVFTRQKLYVVHQQQVGFSVFFTERSEAGINRGNQLIHKVFALDIYDFCGRCAAANVTCDGKQQMGLAQTAATVDKQGVIKRSGLFCHGQSGGVSKTVVITDNITIEGITGIYTVVMLTAPLLHLIGKQKQRFHLRTRQLGAQIAKDIVKMGVQGIAAQLVGYSSHQLSILHSNGLHVLDPGIYQQRAFCFNEFFNDGV